MQNPTYFSALPEKIRCEIGALLTYRKKEISDISELRLRANSPCSVYLRLERCFLNTALSSFELSELLKRLCQNGVYSHLDTLRDGYIALDGGVRVGIAARARYDGDTPYNFGEIGSLVFRIPTKSEPQKSTLTDCFSSCRSGMLIFSPPRYGKTSALRALASELSYGYHAFEVAVLDERLEFSSLERKKHSLDLLSGYKKLDGIKIALRLLSPDVIIMDELGSNEECEALLEYMRGGVRIIASVHAGSVDEVKSKSGIAKLLSSGVFDKIVGIRLCGEKREYTVYD